MRGPKRGKETSDYTTRQIKGRQGEKGRQVRRKMRKQREERKQVKKAVMRRDGGGDGRKGDKRGGKWRR